MNLLATRRGRLAAFFLLYVTEGIPSGFTGVAVATRMRRLGLDPAAIGMFTAALLLPWAVKWAFGPFVDVISSDRWGRRRGWILATQTLMSITILIAMGIDMRSSLSLFTAVLVAHNLCSAIQDVAIDALAVQVLPGDERGLANGLMFGGQYLGTAVGGTGALFLASVAGFPATFIAVSAAIALITAMVAWPMREPPGPPRPALGLRSVGKGIVAFVRDTGRSFTGSRAALAAIVLALLPMGGYALSLSLQSNLAVELGLTDRQVGTLSLVSTLLSAGFCVLGGWISDRWGRRRSLAAFIIGTTLPTFALAAAMQHYGWIMPVSPLLENRPVPSHELVTLFWGLTLAYAVFQGLMYGVGTAIFMDVTNPLVAATQFTGYMALCNLVFSYSAAWQGHAAVAWGYPRTLVLDGAFGLLSVLVLPLMGALGAGRAPALRSEASKLDA
ncbi:MAG TPA: MFS transporter [Candidatus Eisenbacteria bacterium]|nr:MFS transporter [Candidatus Eisenbacteria bacterium]